MTATNHPTCHFCGNTQIITSTTGVQLNQLISANHWTGNTYIRVHTCTPCFPNIAKAPRRPRAPRSDMVAATDWNMLVLMTKKRPR